MSGKWAHEEQQYQYPQVHAYIRNGSTLNGVQIKETQGTIKHDLGKKEAKNIMIVILV